MAPTIFGRDDIDMFVELAGCSLDEHPDKSNWVEDAGGLPEYICEVARAVKRGGKTTSQAIAIAVSRVKKWAAGVGADKDTQAKAAKALAQWEALKGKNKGKTAAKKSAHALAASAGYGQILCLTAEYSMDQVLAAFQARLNTLRDTWRKANPSAPYESGPPYLYAREVWNTFLIAKSDYGADADMYKVPYSVDDNGDVTFGEAIQVKTQYVEVDDKDLGDDVDDKALSAIAAMTHTNRILRTRPAGTALSRVLALSDTAVLEPETEQAETAPAEPEQPSVGGTSVPVPETADPGYQADEKPRYALRTPAQIKAAWAMINQTLNARKYQAWQLAHIKANIEAAARHKDVDLTALSAALDAHPAVGRILALTVEE